MVELRYALLADGRSDRVLIRIIDWLIQCHLSKSYTLTSEFADLERLSRPLNSLKDRIQMSLEYYRCDILFVHRDAEREEMDVRRREIREAWDSVTVPAHAPAYLCVIPIRMTEAWLLFDEMAIRRSAGNPNGKKELVLPKRQIWEALPDPKENLYQLLRLAREGSRRKSKQFSPSTVVHRIPDLVSDFAPLRGLKAFDALEADVVEFIHARGLNEPAPIDTR